jgi:hypothetical protein
MTMDERVQMPMCNLTTTVHVQQMVPIIWKQDDLYV